MKSKKTNKIKKRNAELKILFNKNDSSIKAFNAYLNALN